MSRLCVVPDGQKITERIIWLIDQEESMVEQLDANRWEQAELIAAELDGGKTQRQLAECSLDQTGGQIRKRLGEAAGKKSRSCLHQDVRLARSRPAGRGPRAPVSPRSTAEGRMERGIIGRIQSEHLADAMRRDLADGEACLGERPSSR